MLRLWWLVNGAWQSSDYTYTAYIAVTITSPVPGATLTSSTVVFQWTAGSATQYTLWIGSTGVGSSNFGGTAGTTSTSYVATGLPTDGRTMYVRLWAQVGGAWLYTDYTYSAYSAGRS
jgi:hypothetical protein